MYIEASSEYRLTVPLLEESLNVTNDEGNFNKRNRDMYVAPHLQIPQLLRPRRVITV